MNFFIKLYSNNLNKLHAIIMKNEFLRNIIYNKNNNNTIIIS